jgi:hypothetical protein
MEQHVLLHARMENIKEIQIIHANHVQALVQIVFHLMPHQHVPVA